MNKPSTFAKRLRELLETQDITQAELSRRTGVSKSSITHYLKGDWEAKQDAVYSIANKTGVSEAWLMGYDVPMMRSTQETLWDAATNAVYNREFNELTESEKIQALNSVRSETKAPTPVSESGLDKEAKEVADAYKVADPYVQFSVRKILGLDTQNMEFQFAARKSDTPHSSTGPDTDVQI